MMDSRNRRNLGLFAQLTNCNQPKLSQFSGVSLLPYTMSSGTLKLSNDSVCVCVCVEDVERYFSIWSYVLPLTTIDYRQLRSATTGTLLLPRVRTSTGQGSFAVFGPATWNSLPPSLRAPELSLSTFKRLLKTQLFSACVNHRLAPLWLNSEFGATYKYPNSTQLNSTLTLQPYGMILALLWRIFNAYCNNCVLLMS